MPVEFIKPSNRLARLVGGKMPRHLPAEMASKAATASVAAVDEALIGIREAVDQLWLKVDGQGEYAADHIDDIYFRAHDLRGLCGTCGETVLAGVADALCSYIEDVRAAGLIPRANIVWLHASSLRRASQDDGANAVLGQYLIESLCALRKKELDAACPKNCSCDFMTK
jgi:hypothetical protein